MNARGLAQGGDATWLPEPALRDAVFHGHYELVRRVGGGGMGVVYEVLDRRTQRRRALKLLRTEEPPTPEQIERFALEATVTATVRSAHLVEVLDAGVDDATKLPFLVMELLEGRDLGDALKERPHTLDEVAAVLDVLGAVLDQVHAEGVVHRDLKPENLFLARQPDGSEVLKVLDFGAAKILSTSLATTRALGSPLYMSPEALEGEGTIDGRADVYAMGHLAFTLFVGEAFWAQVWRDAKGYYAVLLKMMQGQRESASERAAARGVTLPPGFDAWFRRATARARDARYETAGECAAAFTRVARGLPEPHPRPTRRRWLAAPPALLLGASVVLTWNNPASSPTPAPLDRPVSPPLPEPLPPSSTPPSLTPNAPSPSVPAYSLPTAPSSPPANLTIHSPTLPKVTIPKLAPTGGAPATPTVRAATAAPIDHTRIR